MGLELLERPKKLPESRDRSQTPKGKELSNADLWGGYTMLAAILAKNSLVEKEHDCLVIC